MIKKTNHPDAINECWHDWLFRTAERVVVVSYLLPLIKRENRRCIPYLGATICAG